MPKTITNHEHSERPMDMHGAALIQDDGSELPITDEMVKRLLDALSELPLIDQSN